MHKLYLLSGPPRAAKSTIMDGLVKATGAQLVAADALEHGLRNVLIGEPHQMLRDIDFQGTAELKSSFTEVGERKPFKNNGTESALLLQMIEGMLDYYRRNQMSVAFESTEFSPEWVASLQLPDFEIRAVFVGYTNISHADSILAHAKSDAHDWINEWLRDDGGDDRKIRAWVEGQTKACQQLKQQAAAHGYSFFDISTQPFETYKRAVLDALLAM